MEKLSLEQQEADALGMSLEELRAQKQLEEDEKTAAYLDIEGWEIRMRREGATDQDIEKERKVRKQVVARVIGTDEE